MKACEKGNRPGNAPGQPALHYRVGTHGQFLENQLTRLSAHPGLQGLTTRARDDPAIALLDAWSAVLDVLGFYQERIVNEGFLRTATERRSLLELGRAIGYVLRPGVAASTFLSFTLETAPGAPLTARIDAGCKVQSVPEQDQQAQVFETLEPLQAHAAWNALGVLAWEAVPPYWGGRTLYLQGQNTGLQPGDAILVVGDERLKNPGSENWDFRRVARLQVVPPAEQAGDPQSGYTVVTLSEGLGSAIPYVTPARQNPRCFALRTRTALFGQAAPDWRAMPRSLRAVFLGLDDDAAVPISRYPEWPGFRIVDVSGEPEARGQPVHLDGTHPDIVPGSWVVLSMPDYDELYRVVENREEGGARFALSGKSTRLVLSGEHLLEKFNDRLRDTSVFGTSVELPWAQRPIAGLVSGHLITLATSQPELPAGRWLAFSGHILTDWPGNARARQRLQQGDALAALELARDGRMAWVRFTDGERLTVALASASEVQRLRRNEDIDGRSRLELESELQHGYLPLSLRINANVAPASHGDSKQMQIQPEVLGSGDGSRLFQRFVLQQRPLTYVAAATPDGTISSLAVRVDGILWEEATHLIDMQPDDRAYLVRHDDDGTATLQFGDGTHGSRLPSGQMNVEARYRVGIGTAGNLKAGQLSLLLNRPLGVKDVINPVPADGGTDPDDRERTRRNAPLTVRTLGRIVSLRDFEDFAAAFPGIGKAQAVWLWDGQTRLVHLTVIGPDGVPAPHLYASLAAAIDAARPSWQPLRLEPGVMLRLGLDAKLSLDPAFEAEQVRASVRAALLDTFGFAARSYGQPVSGSEVVAAMQRTAGVEAVDLNILRLHDGTSIRAVTGPDGRLPARGARWESGHIRPAQLLLIDPDEIHLSTEPARP